MKNLLVILFLSVFIFSACGQENVETQKIIGDAETSRFAQTEKTESTKTECKICDFDFENYNGDLLKAEINGLLLALNDEYLAWATYDRINKDFDAPRPFNNIQKAEARHIDRLKTLFETYKIPIPENKWIGKVTRFETVVNACKAGVDAEIANRDLYTELFKSTKRDDILSIYKNLQRASDENHLPAFERCGGGRRGQS